MKKFYLCKLCLIVFGALLAVQSVSAGNWNGGNITNPKLIESVSVNCPTEHWEKAVKPLLEIDSSNLKGWDWAKISSRAKTNIHLCDPGHWSSWLTEFGMPKKANDPRAKVKRWPEEIKIFGEDVTHHNSNNLGAVMTIYRELNRYLFTGEISRLKDLVLDLANKNAFTKPVGHRFRIAVGIPDFNLNKYPPYAETVYRVSYTLVATGLAYAALEPHLDNDERSKIINWGNLQAEIINSFDDGIKRNRASLKYDTDRAAIKILSLVSWALTTKQKYILDDGLEWMSLIVSNMNAQGTFVNYLRSKDTRSIHYHNMIYSYLVPIAHLLKMNGVDIYDLPNESGGTISKGVEWVLERSMHPETRLDIAQKQVNESFRQARNNIASLSLVEFVILDQKLSHKESLLNEALNVRTWRGFSGLGLEDRYGFSDMAMPGYYVSCYFSSVPGDPEFLKTNSSYSDWRRFTEGKVTWDEIDY